MGYSAKIKIDTKRPRKDGTAAIFMQVIIDRKKKRFDLDLVWPPKYFSESDLCRARMRKDPDVDDYNIIINNTRSKANTIHKDYRMRGLHLTLDAFVKEYKSDLNKLDFVQFFAQKSFDRWNRRLISDITYEKEKGTLSRLKSMSPELPFYEFTPDWAREFDTHLKSKFQNEHNTRWARHKHVITYLNIAREERLTFTDPYSRFSNKLVEGSWGPLELAQMKVLIERYLDWKDSPLPLLPRRNGVQSKDDRPGLTYAEVVVLRRFLFSCNCALRISDLQELDESMFANGQMSITPHKTARHGTKIDSVPLNDIARMMLDDEIKDVRLQRAALSTTLRIFERYTDQAANRLLKRVAIKTEMTVKLHNHVARYTFASLMDQAGANHTGLMKYMGLKKRETLEKYVKASGKVIAADVTKMNEMIGTFPARPLQKFGKTASIAENSPVTVIQKKSQP